MIGAQPLHALAGTSGRPYCGEGGLHLCIERVAVLLLCRDLQERCERDRDGCMGCTVEENVHGSGMDGRRGVGAAV